MNRAGFCGGRGELLAVPLSVRLLGSPQLQRDEQTIPLPRTRNALLLLALLIVSAGRSVDRKLLADTLWPESDPTTGATNLRQTLAILRKSLGEDARHLVAEGKNALRWEPGASWCDLTALTAALLSGDTKTALELGRYPLLEGFTEPWVVVERERLRERIGALDRPYPVRLPVFLTPFLGRTTERARLTELLSRPGVRLVSVLGMGGMGKTRLAVAVATTQPEPTFVDLGLLPPDASPERLWQAVAEAWELPVLSEAAVCRALGERESLLLLDNAEHVRSSTAQVVARLLARCTTVTVLVTSREPLNLPGEALFRLPPLPPHEAQQLFVQRAGLVAPESALEETALAGLCARLEGLPLAIELAAARLRILPLVELEAHLSDRFRLLATQEPQSERHRSLQATLDASWRLLTEQERGLLARLSVLVGLWTREVAQAIAFSEETDALGVAEALGRLADRSWLQRHEGRYQFLETIREYLLPMQPKAVRLRLVEYARHLAPWSRERETESVWLARVWQNRELLRAALRLADPETRVALAVALGDAFVVQGRTEEGIALYESLEPGLAHEHPLRAALLYNWALLEQARDCPERAETLLDESRQLCEERHDTVLLLRILSSLGLNARNQKNLGAALHFFEKALALAEPPNVTTLIRLGVVEHDLGNLESARTYLKQAEALEREQGREVGLAMALGKRGYVERDAGAPVMAERCWREALGLLRSVGYLRERGYIALALGTLVGGPEQRTLYAEAREAFLLVNEADGLARLEAKNGAT